MILSKLLKLATWIEMFRYFAPECFMSTRQVLGGMRYVDGSIEKIKICSLSSTVDGKVINMITGFIIINLCDSMCQNELFHMLYCSIKNAFACCLE